MQTTEETKQHPRPDFRRSLWTDLNGTWRFSFDDQEIGEQEHWYSHGLFDRTITVPYVYQCKASTIGNTEYHPVLWYARDIEMEEIPGDLRVFVNFGAVDFETKIWVNGSFIGVHRGGYTPFAFDATDFLKPGSNILVVKVVDRNDPSQPRGKQYWEPEGDRCWYTQSSGIWQSVWLEYLPQQHINTVRLTPVIDHSRVDAHITLSQQPRKATHLRMQIWWEEDIVRTVDIDAYTQEVEFSFSIDEPDSIDEIHHWSPEKPNLYRVVCTLIHGENTDQVETWFGMRKISIRNGKVLLNNKPLYQRLLLVQGYWVDTLLTPPSFEALSEDLKLIKQMGFNGIRMHQKIEDPRFYHLADVLGLLVWAEMPSFYSYNERSREAFINEWTAFIGRDYNHPSIICWVPFNESWGIRNICGNRGQQEFARAIYHLTKSYDNTRPVDTNDGWEQVDSDLCCIHDYTNDELGLQEKWADAESLLSGTAQQKLLYAEGFAHEGQPVLITEFGGIAFNETLHGKNWGYTDAAESSGMFISRIGNLVRAIRGIGMVQGFCYTQFTDVMQEVNGLVDIHRNPKVPVDELARIFSD